jgi:hypothetical protein
MAFGAAVFMVMMVGVGGYQAVASHTIKAFTLGIDPAPSVPYIGTPAGSALSMCGLPSDGSGSSIISVHAGSWRHSSSSKAGHSPTGLLSACN